MSSLIFDLRDALRSFRRDRASALTVILTLALTIGAVTAVFSIVHGLLLKPLVAIATCGLAAWRGLALDPATALRDA